MNKQTNKTPNKKRETQRGRKEAALFLQWADVQQVL